MCEECTDNTDLLLLSHPLVTKLVRTISACAFVSFDCFKKLTSRNAARDETQYDSKGASIICSTYRPVADEYMRNIKLEEELTTSLKYAISTAEKSDAT